MSGATNTLKLSKNIGSFGGGELDANFDALDAFLTSLTAIEVDANSGAIAIKEGTVLITKTSGAAAMTLALPVVGPRSSNGDDGKKLKVIATTSHAHTLTVPSNGINGASDTVTFEATGDFVELVASNGVWYATLGGPTPAALSEV